MKLFECQHCGQLLYFENTRCERCGHTLGYLPDQAMLSALVADGADWWRPLACPEERLRLCANAAYDACNWLVPQGSRNAFCRSCQLNRTLPDLSVPENVMLWRRLERAKRRLVYSLLRLGLPVVSKSDELERGIAFNFVDNSGIRSLEERQATTGHLRGLITVDIAEADDAARERHRQSIAESYRTVLGHLRHESGHYHWDRLIRDSVWHGSFQTMFGDERCDYAASLQAHYADGPQSDWRQRYVSAYAGAHPWEDFAETWAHYLHIVDTLETAAAFGLHVRPSAGGHPRLEMSVDFDPYQQSDFDALVAAWLPLTFAVNSLNQSMGQPDLYPFVLAPTIMGKLRFVHGLARGMGGHGVGPPSTPLPKGL